MALDKERLKADLLTMMNSAKEQGWTAEQVATAMSGAIDRYTRDAEVLSVKVQGESREYAQSNKGRVQ